MTTKKITIILYLHSTDYYHKIKAKNPKHENKKIKKNFTDQFCESYILFELPNYFYCKYGLDWSVLRIKIVRSYDKKLTLKKITE